LQRITARKYLGDDASSWAVFIDGRPFVTGLTRSEVAYYKAQARRIAQERRPATKATDAQEETR